MNIADRLRPQPFVFVLLIFFTAGGSVIYPQTQAGRTFAEFIAGSRTANDENSKTSPKSASLSIEKLCPISDRVVAEKLIAEYGAAYSAAATIQLPDGCFFPDAVSLKKFQSRLVIETPTVNGMAVTLQKPAAEALLKAVAECQQAGVQVHPFDGSIAGSRSYQDTVQLWTSRFFRALDYWTAKGRIDPQTSLKVRNEPLVSQLRQIIEWEDQGIWFGTTLSGSIFSSTAPPGTSQHLMMIAFDVQPPVRPEVISIFNANGWYQTVRGDANHFTYLGLPESELPNRGLRKVNFRGSNYWVPALTQGTTTSGSD